jgi:hypothetical protein
MNILIISCNSPRSREPARATVSENISILQLAGVLPSSRRAEAKAGTDDAAWRVRHTR